jgi:hypothetical protein
MERGSRTAIPRDVEQLWIKIEPFGREMVAQDLDVETGTAPDIQQCCRSWMQGHDVLEHSPGGARMIEETVLEVIEWRGSLVHDSIPLERWW